LAKKRRWITGHVYTYTGPGRSGKRTEIIFFSIKNKMKIQNYSNTICIFGNLQQYT
jgi:hypothetical protein